MIALGFDAFTIKKKAWLAKGAQVRGSDALWP
jgi:hypothetical protein